MSRATPDEIAAAAQLACVLEASADKPGNVSPSRPFADTRYEDYLASAIVLGPVLAQAGRRPLGQTIDDAITATAQVTERNTNLGIVLLLAPLARAALRGGALREQVRAVLEETTVEDARTAYAAIRRATPGGLGSADSQDVRAEPTVTLLQAMSLAAERDAIASEWRSGFRLTFDVGGPALARARSDGLPWLDAVVECFLRLLAESPDTLIARKLGAGAAADVSCRARAALAAGGVRTGEGRAALHALDETLRDERNTRNPGTTADLTAAAIFVTLLEHGWRRGG